MRNPEAIRSSYKLYKNKGGKLEHIIYGEILRRFNLGIKKLLIEEGFEFKMPYNLGYLGVRQFHPKIFDDNHKLLKSKIFVDFDSTIKLHQKKWGISYEETRKLIKKKREEGKKVKLLYHFNNHSNGKVYRASWVKANNQKHRICYKYEPCKSFKKSLSKRIKNYKPEYLDASSW